MSGVIELSDMSDALMCRNSCAGNRTNAAGSSYAALLHAGCTRWQQHSTVRVLTHIKRLDDVFGDFLVRVVCECGAVCEIEPEALARLGSSAARSR